jgi:hypothetical protein
MRILGSISLILVFAAGAAADTPAATKDHRLRDKEIRQWLDAEWERAARLPDLGERRGIAWTKWQLVEPHLPKEILNRLPPGAKVTQADTKSEHALFTRGDELWRYNSTLDVGKFLDICYNKKAANGSWQLSFTSMEYFDAEEVAKESPAQGVLAQRRVFLPDVGRLLYGDFSWRMIYPVVKDDAQVTEFGWSVIVRTKSQTSSLGYAVRYVGVWSDEANRGFVIRTESPAMETSEQAGAEVDIYEDWQFLPSIGLWSAGRIATYKGSDTSKQPERIISLVGEVDTHSEDPYAIPAVNQADAVRGKVPVRTVVDHVNRKKEVHTESGATQIVPLPVVVSSGSSFAWLRTAGWVALGCVCATLLVIWRIQRVHK